MSMDVCNGKSENERTEGKECIVAPQNGVRSRFTLFFFPSCRWIHGGSWMQFVQGEGHSPACKCVSRLPLNQLAVWPFFSTFDFFCTIVICPVFVLCLFILPCLVLSYRALFYSVHLSLILSGHWTKLWFSNQQATKQTKRMPQV